MSSIKGQQAALLCLFIFIAVVTASLENNDASPGKIKGVYEPSYLPPGSFDDGTDETNDLQNSNDLKGDGQGVVGGNVQHPSDVVDDFNAECQARVKNGECNSNPYEMVGSCLKECFQGEDFGAIGYFPEKRRYDEDDDGDGDSKSGSNGDRDSEPSLLACLDVHEEDEELYSCEEYQEKGECATDPGFMLYKCALSCWACREPGVTTFPIGKAQEIHEDDIGDDEAIQKTAQIITDTFSYMEKIMTQPQYTSIRTICRNNDEFCSAFAAGGSCEEPQNFEDLPDDDEDLALYNFMMSECAPACQSCDDFITEEIASIVKDCVPDHETNILEPGDLNKMFERIVGESEDGEDAVVPKSDVNILSRPSHPRGFAGKDDDPTEYVIGPWVVTLDNFLSKEECDHLIKQGQQRGYERSTLEEEKDYSEDELEQEKNGDDAYRTSKNAWCEDECYDHPVTQKIIQRLSNATGIPDTYAEPLQLLSYVPGQYYKEHHDWITDGPYEPSGPRLITFFLYLNDVEEGSGGSTRLTDLTGDDGGLFLDVQPKKGMALIWPNALDEDPMRMDVRTYHEALPVLKGRKYGANAWFHLRNYKDDKCDYDAFNEEAGVAFVDNDELEEDTRDEL